MGAVRSRHLPMSPGLPFQGEVNTGFGVLAKVYVDATISFYQGMPEGDPEQADVKAAKDQAFEVLEDTFVVVKTPKLEIERGFRFWDAVSLAFQQRAFRQDGWLICTSVISTAHGVDPCHRKSPRT